MSLNFAFDEDLEKLKFWVYFNIKPCCSYNILPFSSGKGVYKQEKRINKKIPLQLKRTEINNLIRKYSFMRNYLNIILVIFISF